MKTIQPGLQELYKYKCMFFDFDGVVLESGDIKTDAFIELFSGLGIDEEVRQHHLANQGISRYDKFKWITENLLKLDYSKKQELDLGERFASIVTQKVIDSPFVAGFEKMIESIRNKEIYCVVASGTPEVELHSIIQKKQLSDFFDEVHGSPRKKDEIVLEVLSRKKFDRSECLFFGDASTDFEAAELVGIDFFARLTSELDHYWSDVSYKFGVNDFRNIT